MKRLILLLLFGCFTCGLDAQEFVAQKRYQNLFPHFIKTGDLLTPLQKAIVISQRPCDTLVFFMESPNRLYNVYCAVNDSNRTLTESKSRNGNWIYSALLVQNPAYCPYVVAQWNCDSVQKVQVNLIQSPGDTIRMKKYMNSLLNEGLKALTANYLFEKWQVCNMIDKEVSYQNGAPYKVEIPAGEWLLHIAVIKSCRDKRIQITGFKQATDRYMGTVDAYSEVPESTGEFTTVFLLTRIKLDEPGYYYFLVDEIGGSSEFCPYDAKIFIKPM